MNTVYAVVVVVSVFACVTDLRTRRIPNVLTFGSAAAGLVFHLATGGVFGLFHAVAGWSVGIVLFGLPFFLGGMGGGDIKLLAALGAWLGPEHAFWLALYTGVAGGVMSLVVATMYGYLGTALSNVWLLLTHWRVVGLEPVSNVTLAGSAGPKLAYAVPILIGAVFTMWLH